MDTTGDLQLSEKIIHSGDTNTAIRFPSNDTITFETSGTTRLEASTTGVNVVGSFTVNGSAVGGGSTADVRTNTLQVVGVSTFNNIVDLIALVVQQ